MRHATLAALVALLAAACGGGEDPMPTTRPAAMWPVTITAGVNDAIDFAVNGGAEKHATIAAGTYYSPPELAEAVRAALETEVIIGIAVGVNDAMEIRNGSGDSVAYLAAGAWTPAELEDWIEYAWGGDITGSVSAPPRTLTMTASPLYVGDWTPRYDGPYADISAWPALGYTTERAQALSQVADRPIHDGPGSWAVSVSDAGRFTITFPIAFSLKFATGANAATSARDVLGFGAVDTASAVTVTGSLQMQNAWFAPDPVADDTGDLDDFERAQTVSLSGATKSVEYGDPDAPRRVRTISLAFLPAHKVFIDDEGANANEAIQRLLRKGWTRFRWFPDQTDLATGTDYALSIDSAKSLPRNRLSPGNPLYALTLRLRKFV